MTPPRRSPAPAPGDASYGELLEGLALEVAHIRRDAAEARAARDTAESRLSATEERVSSKAAALDDTRHRAQAMEVAVLDLQATVEKLTAERDALAAERASWVAQMERDNGALRAVFHDARAAKEQLMTEMAALEEEHAKVDGEREAFLAREGQLVAFITSRGMVPPPIFQLPPAYAAVLTHYLGAAAAAGSAAASGGATVSGGVVRRASDAPGSVSLLADDAVSVASATVNADAGAGATSATASGAAGARKLRPSTSFSDARLGPVRAAPPPPPGTAATAAAAVTAPAAPAEPSPAQQLAAIRAGAVALREQLVSGRA